MIDTDRDAAPDDLEVTMQIFRLARDGGFRRAAQVIDAAKKYFPTASEEQIKRCAARLAKSIRENGL